MLLFIQQSLDDGRNFYNVPATPTTDSQFVSLALTADDAAALNQESQAV